MSINLIFYYIFCMIGGSSIACGFVAFVTLLGVFEKLTTTSSTNKYVRPLEILIIVGVTVFNLFFLLSDKLPVKMFHLGFYPYLFVNLIGGIFLGCVAGALAEVLDVFPIISRRFGIRKHLPVILISAAIGKCIGCIIDIIY